MLELKEVSFTIRKDGEEVPLVDRVSLTVPKGHFMAIVGPSGCGKTTLLKTIAGLNPESGGALFWDGRNLSEDGDFSPSEIGYVPQFSIAYDPLTVDESVEAATRLRVRCRNTAELDHRIDRVLEETGLSPISDRQVKVLSGGQKRRLGLAMELVSDPKLLLCDEVTSGLDPRSEREIVRLLHDLSRKDGRIVLSVTHSLAHLELYDSILVLHEGRVAFHGPPEQLTHYFSVSDTEEVYPRLATQPSERWHDSWQKHRESYQKMIGQQPRAAHRQRRTARPAGTRHAGGCGAGFRPDGSGCAGTARGFSASSRRCCRAAGGSSSGTAARCSCNSRSSFVSPSSSRFSATRPPATSAAFPTPGRPTSSRKSRSSKASARTRPRSARRFPASSCSRWCCSR